MFAPLLVAASLVVAPVPEDDAFGDWIVACDNGRHCEAVALPPDDGSNPWTLYVEREADPSAVPSISAQPAFGDWEGEARPVRLVIDSWRTEFGFDAKGDAVGDGMAMLAAVAAGRRVAVADLNGKELGELPVTGASAALRWMDDRQKRSGTVTALIARGARPASQVPAPPALPRISQPAASAAPPAKLGPDDVKSILKGTNFCDEEPFEQVETYRLDKSHTVGIVPCMRHAYQSSYAVVIIDQAGKWSPAPIEQPEPPPEHFEAADAYLLTEGHYSKERRLLFMASKGRGLADCGSSASWAWDGKMFRLASYRALGECRGAPPGTWLSRWRTANGLLAAE